MTFDPQDSSILLQCALINGQVMLVGASMGGATAIDLRSLTHAVRAAGF